MKANELLNLEVSYYSRCTYNKSYKTIRLYDWISKYTLRNCGKIMSIRKMYEEDPTKAKKMKADNLPCITVTGGFNECRRVDLAKKLNPIFVIDIDKADNPDIEDWNELKKKVASLPYVFLTSYSCSGRGVYAMIYFDINVDVAKMSNALYEDFKQMGIIIDKQCKDITRLRFISYDDNILIRQNEIEMYNKELEIEQPVITNTYGSINESDAFIYQAIYHLITKCNYRSNRYAEWLQDGFRLATFGDLGYILFMLLSMRSDNFDEQAAKDKFAECTRTTKYTKASLVYYFGRLKEYYGDNWKQIING